MTTPSNDQTMVDIPAQPPTGPPPPSAAQAQTVTNCFQTGEGQGPITQLCPTCNSTVWTTVTTSTTILGFVWFFLCYCFCCVCSLLPFYLNTFKKNQHFCPKCGALLRTISPVFSCKKKIFFIIVLVLYILSVLFGIYVFLKYIGLV